MTQLTIENIDALLKKRLDHGLETQASLINGAFQTQKDYFDKRLDGIDKRLDGIEHELRAVVSKLSAHLELSDKRYLELKRRDLIIGKWIKRIADKTGVEIDLAELEKF